MVNDFPFAAEGDFDKHIAKSINRLDDLYFDTMKISEYFVETGTNVYDIGCSTGSFLINMAINNKAIDDVSYVGIDSCADFSMCRERNEMVNIQHSHGLKNVDFYCSDAIGFPMGDASFITSLFTLQFISQKDKPQLLAQIYNALNSGGCFVLAEKLAHENGKVGEILGSLHRQFKRFNFTEAEILDKEKKLRSCLRCNTEEELCELIEDAGFKNVEPFWQNHMFTGYMCIK